MESVQGYHCTEEQMVRKDRKVMYNCKICDVNKSGLRMPVVKEGKEVDRYDNCQLE